MINSRFYNILMVQQIWFNSDILFLYHQLIRKTYLVRQFSNNPKFIFVLLFLQETFQYDNYFEYNNDSNGDHIENFGVNNQSSSCHHQLTSSDCKEIPITFLSQEYVDWKAIFVELFDHFLSEFKWNFSYYSATINWWIFGCCCNAMLLNA